MSFKKVTAFLFALVAILFVVNGVSATVSQSFYPVSAVENTGGTSSLSYESIDSLFLADGTTYATNDNWDSSYTSKIFNFTFNPGIDTTATINSATINFRWTSEPRIVAAQYRIVNASGSEKITWTNFSTIRHSLGTDSLSLSGFSASDLNGLVLQFRAYGAGAPGLRQTEYDLVQLQVNYAGASGNSNLGPTASIASANVNSMVVNLIATCDDSATGSNNIQAAQYFINSVSNPSNSMTAQDGVFNSATEVVNATFAPGAGDYIIFVRCQDSLGAWGAYSSKFVSVSTQSYPLPSCSVDSLSQIGGSLVFNLTQSLYVNQTGDYFVNGLATANSADCTMNWVGYNRTSPNKIYYSWANADNQGLWTKWRTSQNDVSFVDGTHTVCCSPESKVCSGNNCVQLTGNSTCKTFCIDTQVPVMDSITDNSNDCSEEGRYTNTGSATWTWSAHDNGCAGIKEYSLTLYNATSGTVRSYLGVFNTTSIGVGLEDGSWMLSVVPVDNAGHAGNAMNSSVIIADTQAPSIVINSPSSNQWFKTSFNVSESETDVNGWADENACTIAIYNDGVLNYSQSVNCGVNQLFSVLVKDYCDDGNCTIVKTAKDRACNSNSTSINVQIDTLPPVTTKEVGKPRVNASEYSDLLQWVAQLVNGFFVSNTTQITLSASDSGIGMGQTYYNLTYPNGTVFGPTLYAESFPLPNIDGKFNITYWSVDALNNTEVAKYEVDKLDNIAPNTTKTWGAPNYTNASGALWVTSNTVFNLTCNDSEVGCDYTEYKINNNEEWSLGNSFSIQGKECASNFVEYSSVDRLGNTEVTKNETDWLDNNGPEITIDNPNFLELNRTECYLNVLASVSDRCSGLNSSSVRAEIKDAEGKSVSNISLKLNYPLTGGYSNTVDTTNLLPGEYTLFVYASDNLGNTNIVSRNFTIRSGIFVQYVNPYYCSVPIGQSGECSFTFNACVRGSDQINMFMEKLGAGHSVDPGSVNATIRNNLGSAQVGVWETDGSFKHATNLSIINNSCNNVNGWVNFNLTMSLDSQDTTILGGNYQVNYTLNSFDNLHCAD